MTVALDAVREGEADGAVVPIENSVEGSVPVTLDELATGEPLMITREMTVPVAFSLLARPGTPRGHPPGRDPPARRGADPALVRAAPARRRGRAHLLDGVRRPDADPARTRTGTRRSPRRWPPSTTGWRRWPPAIGDNPDALTRFVLVSRPGPPPPPTGARQDLDRRVHARRPPGCAAWRSSTSSRCAGVNMTRIESRPTGAALGNYCFSVDCEGHLDDARVGEALMGLRRVCADVRFLGSYERHDGVAPDIRVGTSDREFHDAAAWLARLRHGA